MRIGYDAKRAFHNGTGLGHYSRTLIRSLASTFPEHSYYLFNPSPSVLFNFSELENVHEILPTQPWSKILSSAWRSSWVKSDINRLKLDIYHGLSHEIPLGVQHLPVRTVVTMHDLIHERYPEQYKKVDVQIYRKKFRYACEHAHRVIAISQQTKDDLVAFYKVPEEKIRVCYQSCNPSFGQQVSLAEKERVKNLYQLPDKFFLYVGSVIERKNLLTICKAIFLLRNETKIPLVVIGEGGAYLQQVKDYVRQNGISNRVIFLSETEAAKNSTAFKNAADFPAIYQQAMAMIYPSFFEGFGIPVLEALFSRLPVITSNLSCLPEAGGDGALYINPHMAEEMAAAMLRIIREPGMIPGMQEAGWRHAQHFTPEKCAAAVMEVYYELVKNNYA